MANYYTYGKAPTAEETVFGPLSQGYADGGEVDEEAPSKEPMPNIFVEGADVPQSSGFNMGALDELFANLRKTEELQKLALEPGLLQQGFTGTSGVTAPPSGAGIFATPTRAEESAIDFDVTPEMAGALQEVARPAEITAAEREAVTSNPRVQALQQISDQLKANEFGKAFDTALAAERDLGGDFVGNIIDSNKMRALRGPMTAEEITKFYNEMPQKVFEERYLGPGNEFKKEQAIERNVAALGGQEGYVDPMLGVKKEETLLSKLPVKELAALAAAAMGATAIPGLFGAGAGSGAGAGAAGSAGAAGGAGAAGAAGAGAGALTGVVPTGLVAGTTAANLALPVFTVTAGGGLTAAQLAALGAAGLGGAGALTGGSAAAPTTTTAPTPEAPLEEVVVQATRPPVVPPAAAVVPAVGALTTVEPPIEPPLEEVVVEAKRPVEPEVSVPPPLSPPSTPVETVTPEPPLEEVVVEAKRPPPSEEIIVPPVIAPPSPPVVEPPLEEVVVEAKRPPPSEEIIVPPVIAPPSSPVVEPPLEEVVVEAKRSPPSEEIIVPPVIVPPTTPVDIPKEPTKINEPPADDKLKSLLDKYGSLENLLKLLGALGAAGAGGRGTTPTAPTGGMGGALPKYTYTRQQVSPDIDYYTYGTRPEAKFFEQGFQLEKPTQPASPQPEGPPAGPLSSPAVLEVERPIGLASDTSDQQVYATPSSYTDPTISEEDPERYREMLADMQSFLTVTPREGATEADIEKLRQQMSGTTGKAQGGLMGYAKGGSNETRYFDGPGSGRDDKIPALLSDGEYVMDAETLALLGDGSTKEGARRMDQFRANIRKHKGRALSRGQISPDAKTPEKYMGGGLS